MKKKIKIFKTIYMMKEKVYEHLVEKANNEIFSNVPTLIFINSDNVNFLNETKEISALKEIYKDYNFFDPREKFIEYLKINKGLKKNLI